MKKHRLTKSLLRRVEPMVKAGMMGKPKWYRAMKETPPAFRRPSNGLKELKLPWDRLAKAFVERNPLMVEDPEWLGPNGLEPGSPPLMHKFAKRQYALMQKGIPQEEAYTRVEAAMRQEREADLAAMRTMVLQAAESVGARPSFVSDDGVYDGLRQWQAMMSETKYSEWDKPAKVGLDTFLRREVLKWDDKRLKDAETSRDGTARSVMAETTRLRLALFPETKSTVYECPSDVVVMASPGEDGGDLQEEQGGTEGGAFAEEGEIGDEEWASSMQEFEETAVEHPFESDWDMQTRRRLDSFVMRRCVRRAVLEEAFDWIPPPPSVEDETLSPGHQAEADASVDGDVPGDETSTPSPGRRAPDFLFDEGGRLDLDLDLDDRAGATGKGGLREGGAVDAEGGLEGAEEEEDDGSERWIVCGGGEQDERGFDEDWMAAARYRARRELAALSSMPKKSFGFSKEGKGSPEEALRKNLEKVLNQAKRQLLPRLVLEVDEKGLSPEERAERLAGLQKTIMVDIKKKNEEIEKDRQALLAKLKEEFGAPEGLPWHYREQRMQEGVSRAEKRRLRKKEKLAMKEYDYNFHQSMFGPKTREQREAEEAGPDPEEIRRCYPRLGEVWESETPVTLKRSYPAKRKKPVLWRTPGLPIPSVQRKKM